MMLISINCQVFLVDHTDTNKFSLFKSWSAFQEDSLLRKNVCRTHARANKTCQEKLGRVYEVYISFFLLFLVHFFICFVECRGLCSFRISICNLFGLYNINSDGLLKDFLGMKNGKKICWRDLTLIWRHLCWWPLIDHGQQPKKMPTVIVLTLLYRCSSFQIFFILEGKKEKWTYS